MGGSNVKKKYSFLGNKFEASLSPLQKLIQHPSQSISIALAFPLTTAPDRTIRERPIDTAYSLKFIEFIRNSRASPQNLNSFDEPALLRLRTWTSGPGMPARLGIFQRRRKTIKTHCSRGRNSGISNLFSELPGPIIELPQCTKWLEPISDCFGT